MSVRGGRVLAALLAVACGAAGLSERVRAQSQPVLQPPKAIALAPYRRGDVNTATVIAPGGAIGEAAALAFDAGGDLFVADRSRNRIATIDAAGKTSIVAGAADGSAGSSDGGPQLARFRAPSGLAVRADGTLVVADRGNGAVRSVAADGTVKTLARAPFDEPSGIAADRDGDVFVIDRSTFVREIDPSGAITALPFTVDTPSGIAFASPGSLIVSDRTGLTLYVIATKIAFHVPIVNAASTIATGVGDLHLEGFRSIGMPAAVTAAGDRDVFYLDASDDSLRYIDIALGVGRRVAPLAPSSGKPTALAVGPNGQVAVASNDGAIVSLTNLDLRKPIIPAVSGLLALGLQKDDYAVAVIGNSFTWWNTDFPDSIEGGIESALEPALSAQGLHARVLPISILDSKLESGEQYLSVLGEAGLVRAVVLVVNETLISTTDSLSLPDVRSTEPRWGPPLVRGLGALQKTLRDDGIDFVVVVHPEADELAPAGADGMVDFATELAASGVPTLDLYSAFRTAATSGSPLFGNPDQHFVLRGRQLVADAVATYYLGHRPWRRR